MATLPGGEQPREVRTHGGGRRLSTGFKGALPQANIDEHSGVSVTQQLRDFLSANKARVTDLFRSWDADDGGTIERGEFRKAMGRLGVLAQATVVDALFDAFDKDASGILEFSELERVLKGSSRVHLALDHSLSRSAEPKHEKPKLRIGATVSLAGMAEFGTAGIDGASGVVVDFGIGQSADGAEDRPAAWPALDEGEVLVSLDGSRGDVVVVATRNVVVDCKSAHREASRLATLSAHLGAPELPSLLDFLDAQPPPVYMTPIEAHLEAVLHSKLPLSGDIKPPASSPGFPRCMCMCMCMCFASSPGFPRFMCMWRHRLLHVFVCIHTCIHTCTHTCTHTRMCIPLAAGRGVMWNALDDLVRRATPRDCSH